VADSTDKLCLSPSLVVEIRELAKQ